MEPVSTNGISFFTHSYMMPSVMIPVFTALAIDPAARTMLIARMGSPCPPCVISPVLDIPSVVP